MKTFALKPLNWALASAAAFLALAACLLWRQRGTPRALAWSDASPAGSALYLAVLARDATMVLQAEQRGTGHALLQAMPAIPDDHQVLVLYGDTPLVTTATLEKVLEAAQSATIVVIGVVLGAGVEPAPDETGGSPVALLST